MISRRDFLRISSLAASSLVLSSGIQGCSAFTDTRTHNVRFDHGVASGDPLTDRVIIWTRVTPEMHPTSLRVSWQVFSDSTMGELIRSGTTTTDKEGDYTVKVDLTGLEPGTNYYYQFICEGARSELGRTKTLPAGSLDSLTLAFFSCSNYPAGFFNAYMDASKRDDIDIALHLGDFLYEYGAGGYATEGADEIGRSLPEDNNTELFYLEDYRKRYALYRTDGGSKALHARLPIIVIWDDHEISNDSWRNGAENHNDGEGSYKNRKEAALKAYFEWMPIRPFRLEDERIYRSFDFGDLVSLHMLDTRIIGRDEPLDIRSYFKSGEAGGQQMLADIDAPSRQLLGSDQYAWLKRQMQESESVWQILGQQLLMMKMQLPFAMISKMYTGRLGEEDIARMMRNRIRELNGDRSLTETEVKELQFKVPYNLDAWDGYSAQRDDLLDFAKETGKPIISLAGDTHNAWAGVLRNREGIISGLEVGTPSVTSPGMETYLKLDSESGDKMAQVFSTMIDDLQFCELTQRGYTTLHLTREKVIAEWLFLDTIRSETYEVISRSRFEVTKDRFNLGWEKV